MTDARIDTVRFVVIRDKSVESDNGEFGVLVNGKLYSYYKDSEPVIYLTDSEWYEYRELKKREFGEVIETDLNRREFDWKPVSSEEIKQYDDSVRRDERMKVLREITNLLTE